MVIFISKKPNFYPFTTSVGSSTLQLNSDANICAVCHSELVSGSLLCGLQLCGSELPRDVCKKIASLQPWQLLCFFFMFLRGQNETRKQEKAKKKMRFFSIDKWRFIVSMVVLNSYYLYMNICGTCQILLPATCSQLLHRCSVLIVSNLAWARMFFWNYYLACVRISEKNLFWVIVFLFCAVAVHLIRKLWRELRMGGCQMFTFQLMSFPYTNQRYSTLNRHLFIVNKV